MIAVDKRGRLGNQMFQYAFGLAVAQRLGTRFAYDTSELERYFELPGSARGRGATRLMAWTLDRLVGLERREVLTEDYEDPDVILASATDRTFYGGHFYSCHFFEPSSAAVRGAFTVREVHVKGFETKYGVLLRDGYIAAHVRLTDFFTYRNDVTLRPGYYRRAFDQLDTALPIVVVSDEPERVRAALGDDPRIQVEANDEIIDFLLLRHATQVVTSNSSFAWWAAWLNDRPGLRVVAPRWWLGLHAEREFPVKVIPEEWQQVEARRPEDGEWPPV
jgi:hypothetical protein